MKKATLTLLMSVTFLYFACANEQSMETNIGDKFGRLTITDLLKIPKKSNPNHFSRWANCVCDCGKSHKASLPMLLSGRTKSCGCYRRELNTNHGLGYHPLFRIRNGMQQRCYNSNHGEYPNYGARGIKMCDEWLNDAGAFIRWGIENGWREGLTIDRDNVDGDYEPTNCRFATQAVQQSNRRDNIYIEVDGVTKTLSQWSRFYGISRYKLRYQYTYNRSSFTDHLVNLKTSQS